VGNDAKVYRTSNSARMEREQHPGEADLFANYHVSSKNGLSKDTISDRRPASGDAVVEDLLHLLAAALGPSATSQGDPSKSAHEGRPVVLCADEQGRV
jgi:hypothetical protein